MMGYAKVLTELLKEKPRLGKESVRDNVVTNQTVVWSVVLALLLEWA